MKNLHPHHLTPYLLSAGLLCSPAVFAQETFSSLFTDAKPILDVRYRYEHVDQDNTLEHANAQTLRTRVGIQTGKWYGLSALVEADNVSRLGDAAYNSTRNGQTDYSVVADPDGSEINQALLRYNHELGSAIAGRQRINLDNQRFVGGVGWRQNEQTYDGVLGQLQPLDKLTLTYAYINNINTIFGPGDNRFDNRTNPANIEGHSHLFNARYAHSPALAAIAYSYLLGLDNIATAPAAALGTLSSKTTGLRLNGGLHGISYALEYARQQDYAGNPQELSSEYYLAELGYALKGATLKAGVEVLGGDSGPGTTTSAPNVVASSTGKRSTSVTAAPSRWSKGWSQRSSTPATTRTTIRWIPRNFGHSCSTATKRYGSGVRARPSLLSYRV